MFLKNQARKAVAMQVPDFFSKSFYFSEMGNLQGAALASIFGSVSSFSPTKEAHSNNPAIS